MIYSGSALASVIKGEDKQWLLTNGTGGFAGSTIAGINTSKYHGLLFASLYPPVDRTLLLANLMEEVVLENHDYLLGANLTGNGVFPDGYRYLQSFTVNPFPVYTYCIEDIILEKTIFMVYGSNTTVVTYNVKTDRNVPIRIKVTPLVNCRHYHHTVKKNDWPFRQETVDDSVLIEAYPGAPKLILYSDKAAYTKGQGYWFEGLYYRQEERRGLDPWEDHFMPGHFEVELSNDDSFSIVASTENERKIGNPMLEKLTDEHRLAGLIETAGYQEEFLNRLVLAADTFIVQRKSTGAKTIIAGYPWFTDWGRDTMIALPGLTLVTGRFSDAKEILQTFARYCADGLIPNMFPDKDAGPLYNSVDATLWFINAAYKYLIYTKDKAFVKDELYPGFKSIIAHFQKGTKFDIKMDDDGLVSAGNSEIQLTWMDAKIGDWVVTPRNGKAVEINALWYNALEIMNRLSVEFEDKEDDYSKMAALTRTSFGNQFWNKDLNCLYDVVNGERKDDAIRPNQILAVSLPFSPLDHARQSQVVTKVWQELYFPFGLRSLSPKNPMYQGIYAGDMLSRDKAYHQGTGWAWLIGPFITAYRKVHDYSLESRAVAEKMIAPFRAHLWDDGIGSIAEIFDGDYPFHPKGCFSQAWSVGEVLRAYVEDVLNNGTEF